jgi:hypothetical protein
VPLTEHLQLKAGQRETAGTSHTGVHQVDHLGGHQVLLLRDLPQRSLLTGRKKTRRRAEEKKTLLHHRLMTTEVTPDLIRMMMMTRMGITPNS